MIISQETQTILKNFSSINQGVVFHPGNKLYTRTSNIIADATVKETFPKEVGIFDLNQFLSLLSLYSDPVLDFGDDCLRIAESDGSIETKYVYAPPGIVSGGIIPKQLEELPDDKDTIEFTITEEQWAKIQKAASALGKEEYKISSDGKVVRISTTNHVNDGGSSLSMVLDANTNGYKCNMVYSKNHLMLLKGSYKGNVTSKFTIFKNTNGYDLTYFVAVEPSTCKFGK